MKIEFDRSTKNGYVKTKGEAYGSLVLCRIPLIENWDDNLWYYGLCHLGTGFKVPLGPDCTSNSYKAKLIAFAEKAQHFHEWGKLTARMRNGELFIPQRYLLKSLSKKTQKAWLEVGGTFE